MWFRLCLGSFCQPLAAAVGRDGYLYWRIVDLGILLGKKNPYSFASRFQQHVVTGRDVFPPGPKYTHNTLRCKLISTEFMYHRLLEADLTKANMFVDTLYRGIGSVKLQKRFSDTVKDSPILFAGMEGNVSIPDWIHQFVADVTWCRDPTRRNADEPVSNPAPLADSSFSSPPGDFTVSSGDTTVSSGDTTVSSPPEEVNSPSAAPIEQTTVSSDAVKSEDSSEDELVIDMDRCSDDQPSDRIPGFYQIALDPIEAVATVYKPTEDSQVNQINLLPVEIRPYQLQEAVDSRPPNPIRPADWHMKMEGLNESQLPNVIWLDTGPTITAYRKGEVETK